VPRDAVTRAARKIRAFLRGKVDSSPQKQRNATTQRKDTLRRKAKKRSTTSVCAKQWNVTGSGGKRH
jgi:hypothetical protein